MALDLVARLGLVHPIVQAPMIGPRPALALAVSGAGGLGSLGCAAWTPARVDTEVAALRVRTAGPFNLNFFAHRRPAPDPEGEAAWRALLAPHYAALNLHPATHVATAERLPFDPAMAEAVAALAPPVVSFHFGLPEEALLAPLRAAGCLIFGCATTVREARWLAERGVDAVVAQGAEAGGHRGLFLTEDIHGQVGTMALVPQVADAVRVPVIAAGGIADARGVAAAFALGAALVQVGTAYLLCPEAGIHVPHRAALLAARDEDTAITNVFTGRPARGLRNRAMDALGPMSDGVPAFPRAAQALQPLRAAAEAAGSGAYSSLWAGQAAALARSLPAAELTACLAAGAPPRRAADT